MRIICRGAGALLALTALVGSARASAQGADPRGYIYVDTHINPSAGSLRVLSRDSALVVALPGWLLGVLPNHVVLYHRNQVHFAPTHSAEVWTWDPATRRDVRLYPNRPWGSVRRAYVDTVRAIYQRVGAEWFRVNNYPMDPERFDSRLLDSVIVGPSPRTVTFRVEFGGGDGTPAATPRLDVLVRCHDVGTARARCVERATSQTGRVERLESLPGPVRLRSNASTRL